MEDQMTVDERYAYLRRMHRRYVQASKQEKSRLLDEMCIMTGLHRKSLIRLLSRPTLQRQPRRRQRGKRFGPPVDDAIRLIGQTLDWVCAERLTPALAPTALQLVRFGEMQLPDELLHDLQTISISQVARIAQRVQQDEPRLPQRRGRARPARGVQADIPMRVIPWDESEPGHFEVDAVVHAGPQTRGDCVLTLQMIDVATAWSERVAVLGRSERAVCAGFAHILSRCPIPILELHPDNGSEFLNPHLLAFFGKERVNVRWSRSRPYHKNDNRFVEQKNATLVRAYLGRTAFTTRRERDLINALYETMWQYYNFFQPVLRQVRKETTFDAQGHAHTHRKHDRARTPLERLLESGILSAEAQQDLVALYELLNPLALHCTIEAQLQRLWQEQGEQPVSLNPSAPIPSVTLSDE